MICHPFPPLFNEKSRILILGSFPSAKSREQLFFYGHPQNRFWKVLAALFSAPVPNTVSEKRAFLFEKGIALWDVIGKCDIEGSADSSIRNVTPNVLSPILDGAPIQNIYVNGRTAEKYYMKYTYPLTGRAAVCLPSTSPANAAFSLERLIEAWKVIL